MKKIILIGALLVVMGGIVLYITRPDPDRDSVEYIKVGTATVLDNNLKIRAADTGNFDPIDERAEVFEGDRLQTDESGRAVLQAETGTVTVLDYSSELTVASGASGKEQTKLTLHSGAAWARVKKVLDQGEFYEIETQNAVASVRGTSFGIRALLLTSEIVIEEGTVKVTPKDPKTGAPLNEQSKLVEVNNKVVISETGEVAVNPLTAKDESDAWFNFNTKILPDTFLKVPTEPKLEESVIKKPEIKMPVKTPTSPDDLKAVPLSKPPAVESATPPPAEIISKPSVVPSDFYIESVNPAKVISDGKSPIEISVSGKGFLKISSFIVGKTEVPLSDVTVVDDTTLRAKIPALPSGTYELFIKNSDGLIVNLPNALTIEAARSATGPTTSSQNALIQSSAAKSPEPPPPPPPPPLYGTAGKEDASPPTEPNKRQY